MPAGGSLQLVQLIQVSGLGGELRADLQQYYGLDLADLPRGTLAPRRILQLVEHLPYDCALMAALRGGPVHRQWDTRTHLLASIVDAVQAGTWTAVQLASHRRVPEPEPLPRPGTRAAAAAPARRPLDLSRHPDARPLPAKYRAAPDN
ncbi:hypothetical protein [Kitasatospora cheerisanensis]|uniref:Uncharacterized protein n=1 Tax=Kitasatospora cheerisanensis KCTC 2395 TaxID=1348663 RepID=A0A066YWM1_9ACTN|nr:hypothetical protein [Kitasatospora cheerisanensis]KDN84374.1 hypothetical protein KCH_41650 [Kitasatospora cheerisanensis KCTC 2395]